MPDYSMLYVAAAFIGFIVGCIICGIVAATPTIPDYCKFERSTDGRVLVYSDAQHKQWYSFKDGTKSILFPVPQ